MTVAEFAQKCWDLVQAVRAKNYLVAWGLAVSLLTELSNVVPHAEMGVPRAAEATKLTDGLAPFDEVYDLMSLDELCTRLESRCNSLPVSGAEDATANSGLIVTIFVPLVVAILKKLIGI